MHDYKEFVRLLRRQYCSRFIQYQDIGIPVERLYDFNPRLGADGQVADNSVRIFTTTGLECSELSIAL